MGASYRTAAPLSAIMGLPAVELGRLAYKFARGGIDIIKEDHGLTNIQTLAGGFLLMGGGLVKHLALLKGLSYCDSPFLFRTYSVFLTEYYNFLH